MSSLDDRCIGYGAGSAHVSGSSAITNVHAVDRVLASSPSFSQVDGERSVLELRLNPREKQPMASEGVLDDMPVGGGPSDSDIRRTLRLPELMQVMGVYVERAVYIMSTQYRTAIITAMNAIGLSTDEQSLDEFMRNTLAQAIAAPLTEADAKRYLQEARAVPDSVPAIPVSPGKAHAGVQKLIAVLREGRLAEVIASVRARAQKAKA